MATALNASNFLYFGQNLMTSNTVFPPDQTITAKLPANIALIRIAVAAVFTAIIVAKVGLTAWSWPVVILGVGFAAYTHYKHLLSEDPLMAAFQKIAGKPLNDLPEFKLSNNHDLCESIRNIKWEDVEHPISRTLTSDGRKVILVKALGLKNEDPSNPIVRLAVCAFVGTTGFGVVQNNVTPLARRILGFVLTCIPPTLGFKCSPDDVIRKKIGNTTIESAWGIYTMLPTDFANEYAAQIKSGVVNKIGD